MIHRLLNSLILLPDQYGYQAPEELGLRAEAVSFPNAQGALLTGLFCQPGAGTAPAEVPDHERPLVLFCPGTAGNLSSHLHYVELLCRAGLAVLGLDYTGFGHSAGQASLQNLITDVLSACDFLQQKKRYKRFGIFGLSIGANIALQVAVLRPTVIAGVAVEGLALQREIIRGLLSTGSMGPHRLTAITYEGRVASPRRPHVLNPLRLGSRLADVVSWAGAALFPFQAKDPQLQARALTNTPVFFIHGVEDPLLPCEATLQVYEAKPGTKRLWLIPGVGHAQEPILAQDAEYAAQLGDFFHGALASPVAAGPGLPPMTATWLPGAAGTVMLQIHNPGPPGLALITLRHNATIDFRTVWVAEQCTIPYKSQGQPVLVSCLRLFEVEGSGAAARMRQSTRGRCYQETFQQGIRALSRALHESRFADLPALLQALPQERPETPFDFFLGLYCVQIMLRTRHKLPPLARAAAEIFTRYWQYGRLDSPCYPPSSLWELAATILGRQVDPGSTIPLP